MTGACYPLSCRIHDINNKLFFRKRKLLEDYGYYKTASGKWHDGHISHIEPRKMTYKELKEFLEKGGNNNVYIKREI